MLNFNKLFTLAKSHGISIYVMYTELHISRSQIYRIKDGKFQAATLDRVLQLLYEETGIVFQPSDICEFVPEPAKEEKKSGKP